jgi:hypothetical protein
LERNHRSAGFGFSHPDYIMATNNPVLQEKLQELEHELEVSG